MNRSLWLLAICQGLFLTNNVTFIAINGLVGLSMAPLGWMATLPVMGYVVGSALSTGLVAKAQHRLGRDIRLSAIYAALHVEGVQRVELTAPLADIVLNSTQASFCTEYRVVTGGSDE